MVPIWAGVGDSKDPPALLAKRRAMSYGPRRRAPLSSRPKAEKSMWRNGRDAPATVAAARGRCSVEHD